MPASLGASISERPVFAEILSDEPWLITSRSTHFDAVVLARKTRRPSSGLSGESATAD